MDPVNTAFLNSVSTFLLTETWRITGQSFWQLLLRNNFIDKLTNHRMFTRTNQIQIFTLDFVHHRIHFIKRHNTCYNIWTNHKRRHTIGKSAVNHKVSCIGNNCRMKSCNIAHQIIESISCNVTCRIQIQSIKWFHNLCMIWDFKIRNHRITKLLNFYIFSIIFTNWNTRVNDVWNYHHALIQFLCNFCLSCF